MKLFFDTNVLISAILTPGHSFEVIKDSIKKHEVYYTDYLLKEIRETLQEKFNLSGRLTDSAINLIKRRFIKGVNAFEVESVCRDADDDPILADCAMNTIEVLITGDKDLLPLKKWKGIHIIAPRDYWKL